MRTVPTITLDVQRIRSNLLAEINTQGHTTMNQARCSERLPTATPPKMKIMPTARQYRLKRQFEMLL
jgi:hypothetical protein